MHLTPRQKEIFLFIQSYIKAYDIAPNYDEIAKKFKFNSYNSVTKHIKQLTEKGVILVSPNKKRGISLVEHGTPSAKIKLLGTIAAGEPIEAIEDREYISVPQELLVKGETFCLKVKGDSMIDDGIHEGDIVIINKKSTAYNGQTVVAKINNEVTLKKYYNLKDFIELRPANSEMKPIRIKSGDFCILGVLVGLMRKY